MPNELKPGECRWIAVNERNPKLGEDVMIVRNGEMFSLPVSRDSAGKWYYGSAPIENVTHWLEVCPPAPPKRTKRVEVSPSSVMHYISSAEFVKHSVKAASFPYNHSINVNLPPDATNIKVSFDTKEE